MPSQVDSLELSAIGRVVQAIQRPFSVVLTRTALLLEESNDPESDGRKQNRENRAARPRALWPSR